MSGKTLRPGGDYVNNRNRKGFGHMRRLV